MTGIYYLWDGACVIYIGKSSNVEQRVAAHAHSDLDFAGYFVDECKPHELDQLEHEAIKHWRPLYNLIT